MKTSNKHFVEFTKQAALAATGSNKPYAAMIKHAGLAAVDGAITKDDQPAFYKALTTAKGAYAKTHKTILDTKRSEAWSCVKLAFEYKECAAGIFANLEQAGTTPTGIYDIACSIRGKAQFADKAPCEKQRIGLHVDSGKAPTVEAMLAAIRHSNAYRNGLTSGGGSKPLAEQIANMAKLLEAFRDGKRDPNTGKPRKDKAGKVITLPVMASKTLGQCISVLNEYKAELAKPRLVVDNKNGKANGRKAAA